MRTIWKFDLGKCAGLATVKMPDAAEIVSIKGHANRLWVYALVDTNAAPVERTFVVVFTGAPAHPLATVAGHVGSAKIYVGEKCDVAHVFEAK